MCVCVKTDIVTHLCSNPAPLPSSGQSRCCRGRPWTAGSQTAGACPLGRPWTGGAATGGARRLSAAPAAQEARPCGNRQKSKNDSHVVSCASKARGSRLQQHNTVDREPDIEGEQHMMNAHLTTVAIASVMWSWITSSWGTTTTTTFKNMLVPKRAPPTNTPQVHT